MCAICCERHVEATIIYLDHERGMVTKELEND